MLSNHRTGMYREREDLCTERLCHLKNEKRITS